MNPFKKLALTFSVLAVLAGSAAAQLCGGGKRVHFQVPDDWTSPFYYRIDNTHAVNVTIPADRWVTFNITEPNYIDANKGFLITRTASESNEAIIVSRTGYNVPAGQGGFNPGQANDPPSATRKGFFCPDFDGGPELYISRDPTNPTRTIFGPNPPNARYFYFLPPDDREWILNAPFLWDGNTTKRMEVAPDHCGWYRLVYFNETPPNVEALIIQSIKDTHPASYNKVGLRGMDEDPVDWVDGIPTPFNLDSIFRAMFPANTGIRNLYFVADWRGYGLTGPWHIIDPGIDERKRCSYSFAAMIYHTGCGANQSFSFYQGQAAGCSGGPGDGKNSEGICKGYARPQLGPDGKMQWAGQPSCGTPVGWRNEEDFRKAFDPNSTSNVARCYDMPFQQRAGGLWEFDALYLCADGTVDYSGRCQGSSRLGGFYVPELRSRAGFEAEYTACGSTCGITYEGDMGVVPKSCVNMWCFDRGWVGGNCQQSDYWCDDGCGDIIPATHRRDPTMVGNLTGLTTAAAINAEMERVCWRPFQNKDLFNYNGPIPLDYAGKTSNVSGLLCFESAPASFTYTPGQEFFFRGDDDIWVFINNQLVLDLGGNHGPAPGYVKLDTISVPERLVEGNEYPIKIFFCDRRGPGSNVRISTNLYFAQETGLSLETKDIEILGDVCLTSSGGGSCADLFGGGGEQKRCGQQIHTNLRYYLTNRAGTIGESLDRIGVNRNGFILDGTHESCIRNQQDAGGVHTLCYGGIKIYESSGKVQVLIDDIAGLGGGTYQVWVTYIGDPNPPPLKLAEFSKNVKVQVVWGDIYPDFGSNQMIYSLPNTSSASVLAGRTVPIGFAAGEWSGNGRFSVSMDPGGGSPGQQFSLSAASFSDPSVRFSDITLCYDEQCNNPVEPGAQLRIPNLGQPNGGLLVLWAKGNFEAEDDATYTINVSGSNQEPFKLNVYQPRIRFVDLATADGTSPRVLTSAETNFSAPEKTGSSTDKWVWLGEQIDRAVVAFDPTPALPNINNESAWRLCGSLCNFKLETEAWATDASLGTGDRVVQFSNLDMKDGVAKFSMFGATPVEVRKPIADPPVYDWAFVKVRGKSELASTVASWDSLQFKEPPVPYPTLVELYDRQGGGRADSIIVVYNKTFVDPETNQMDALPTYLEIIWDEQRTDTIGYGLEGYYQRDGNNRYVPAPGASIAANIAYWQQYLVNDSTIVITRNDYDDSFSGDRIKTAGDGRVVSWSTFDNPENLSMKMTVGNTRVIDEKISPIVISATYIGAEGDCGTVQAPCTDVVIVELSEMVRRPLDENGDPIVDISEIRTAFAYILRSLDRVGDFRVYANQKDMPAMVRWKESGTGAPRPLAGDSIVYLTFRAYKSEGDTAFTPMAGDSIRLLAGWPFTGAGVDANMLAAYPLEDLKGNKPHPKEWGRLIEGKKRFVVDKILIGGSDGTDKSDQILKDKLRELYKDNSVVDNLFTKDKAIELLSIPEEYTPDQVRSALPGTVGVIFKPDIANAVAAFEAENPGAGKVRPEHIKFVAKSFYHTNLGNYVVHRDRIVLNCDDPIFKYDGAQNCMTGAGGGNSNTGLYLAWNLKDAKGRWAGAGAYVQVYDFHWEIEVEAAGTKFRQKFDPYKKIDMFGVKRLRRH